MGRGISAESWRLIDQADAVAQRRAPGHKKATARREPRHAAVRPPRFRDTVVVMTPLPRRRADTRKNMIVSTMALPEALHQRLAIAAVEDRSAITALVRDAVEQWLERRDRKRKAR